MKEFKLEHNGTYTYCNERNLKNYTDNGWVVVVDSITPAPIVKVYDKLTKSQLKELCKDKGVKFTARDTVKILKDKLNTVNRETISEKPSNKGFDDSLIKTK
jgi:hypothetical protein